MVGYITIARGIAQRLSEKWRHCACALLSSLFCTSLFCVGEAAVKKGDAYLFWPPRRVQWWGSLDEQPLPASSLTRNNRSVILAARAFRPLEPLSQVGDDVAQRRRELRDGQEDSESREERKSKPSRPCRSPSPGAHSSSSERLCTISALGIQRLNWRYVASFAGLGTMLDVARGLGGEPACGSDNYGLARALWQQRTGRVCFSSFATYRAMLADSEQRAHHLTRVLVYLSGPPCIDLSIARGQRGTDGNTGQLFVDDAEGALETDAPIVISEIVLVF